MAQVEVLDSYSALDADQWDALVGDGSPFLEHTFLSGLEHTGCATARTGWAPRPVVVRDDDGRIVAGAPCWIKNHSMGEFVYDHAWAGAARNAGLDYYPKLVVGVPFTPVTGQRLLLAPGAHAEARREALLAGVQAAMKGTTGLHFLFNTEAEADLLAERGAFTRLQYQFHWRNEGFSSFDAWLDRFRSKARNKIRRERRDAGALDIRCVEAPDADVLEGMWGFYRNTCRQFGPWGRVYLGREFYRHLGRSWGHRLVVVCARREGELVAGAFNVVKGDRLYGRYWGCAEQHRFLHFEVCYYQAVEYCIRKGLAVFEPGHGGGHKYRRGFLPSLTRSSHVLVDGRLHQALEHHTRSERVWVHEQVEALSARSPLRVSP